MDNILRAWTFWIHDFRQQECSADLEAFVLSRMRAARGNRRASALFRNVADGTVEVVVLSVWNSIGDIRAYAGPDYLLPTIPLTHEDKVFDREPTVHHYSMNDAPRDLLELFDNRPA